MLKCDNQFVIPCACVFVWLIHYVNDAFLLCIIYQSSWADTAWFEKRKPMATVQLFITMSGSFVARRLLRLPKLKLFSFLGEEGFLNLCDVSIAYTCV